MRRGVVLALDSACAWMDGKPVLWRVGLTGRGHHLARLAYRLDERWGLDAL